MRCFLTTERKTAEHYAQIFGGDGGSGDEFGQKWGWYPALFTLAGEDVLKMDAVTALPVGAVFTHLAFLQDLNHKRDQQLKQARMITFNNIVSKFEAFCDDHKFIRTFSYGSLADVDLNKFDQYPLLHLVYTGGDYNTERVKTYNLECYILSVLPSEADKTTYQKESISDAEQVAEDILADIQNGGNIFSFGYHYDVTGASVTPLEESKSNALAGCLLDLFIFGPVLLRLMQRTSRGSRAGG